LKCRDYKDFTDVIQEESMEQNQRKYVLRRLTPTECARLQGFPDWWVDGAEGSDSAIYKMWGNGIALPCAADVIGRIAKEIRRENDEV
jgi:DNA (cytosine-5)-methyltransferase 1